MRRRTRFPSATQLRALPLCPGHNTVRFVLRGARWGETHVSAALYLWNWSDRVIISDIDGTITRSDVLGHLLPHFGNVCTHVPRVHSLSLPPPRTHTVAGEGEE